ncbi:response regulator [Maribacter aestuarii]|uniref:response regulator n=1 Tax=Maribacter aestuarii TaxID=1130723 RepID=UPI00248ADF5F|nr:response regulator transcription factor [Maribacter aestuarii]
MKTQILKIIVIEKELAQHESYKSYFQNFPDYDLVGIYCCANEALKKYKKVSPDVIISEVDLDTISGLDAIKLFRRKDWNVKIIMISLINDFEIIKDAFKRGANGYLTKPMSEDKLLHALNCVRKDGATMSNDIVQKVVSNFHRKTYKLFSERENQIVDYLCKGATYRMIADKLFVTTSAVNFHIQNIYLKLDVNSKSEALTKLEQL